MRAHEWCRRWLSEQWTEWQPRTHGSATEALARFITIADERGAKPPDGLRVYLHTALAPGDYSGLDVQFERWMAKHCLTQAELDRERVADIDRKLGLKLDGSQLAANTATPPPSPSPSAPLRRRRQQRPPLPRRRHPRPLHLQRRWPAASRYRP